MLGRTLCGRYQVLEEIGRGGMGVVYKAYDPHIEIPVAVKVLPPSTREDAPARRRFLQEARLLAPVDHPNVVRVTDADTDGDLDFLVMEFVPGDTLDDALQQGALSEAMVVQLGIQLADGLAAAHQQHLLHRDLKPGNLRITPEGRLKILDFGLAKRLREISSATTSEVLTAPHHVPGTLPYMAPEQLLGSRVDERADLYSAGCVLYEMATGLRTFPNVTGQVLRDKIIGEPPEPPRSVNPVLSRGIERVILRALEKDPKNRQPTAAALKSELELLGKRPAIPIAAWVAAVLTLLAISVISIPSVLALLAPHRTMAAILPFENLTDPKQEWFSFGITDELITNLGAVDPLHLGVIGSSAVRKYRDRSPDLQQVGRDLRVAYVLSGSIERVDTLIRVRAQLDRVKDQSHVWGAHYDQSIRDLSAIQREIAVQIAQTVSPQLLPKLWPRVSARAAPATRNPAAHDAYLKGLYAVEQRTKESLDQALRYFDQALAEDPNFAQAHAGKATVYLLLPSYGNGKPRELMPLAKKEAQRALAMNDRLAEAHTSLASILQDYDWDWDGAEREFKLAIRLNGSYSTAHQWYGAYLESMGRASEALEQFESAKALDPRSLIIATDIGTWFLYQKRYDEAIAQYREVLKADSTFDPARSTLVLALWRKGARDEAAGELVRWAGIQLGPDAAATMREVVAVQGPEGMLKWMAESQEGAAAQGVASSFVVAQLHAMLGNRDAAFAWLDKALEERSAGLASVRVDPAFDSLRQDPRFHRLLRTMGLKS